MEGLSLRVKDVDFDRNVIIVREGKGGKDRVVMLPKALVQPLREQLNAARALWTADRAAQRPGVYMPFALDAKYPRAGQSWAWHWVFPSPTLSIDPRSGIERRHHLYELLPKEAFQDTTQLATAIKGLTITLGAVRPLDEAISTAGGVLFEVLTPELMLEQLPGVFCAGEMLDWEAPTGGYLLQASFATGYRAGRGAAQYLAAQRS